MELNRRRFLKYVGGMAAGAGLSELMVKSLASSPTYQNKLAAPPKFEESFKNSICGLCGCGCGVRVRLVDGIPVKVDGNALHPVNRGGLCARGQASLQFLYNPDRLTKPLHRRGERGQGSWQEISWESALDEVVAAVGKSVAANKSDELVIVSGTRNSLLSRLLLELNQVVKTPHLYQIDLTKEPDDYIRLCMGQDCEIVYDFENTNYILSFGARLLESEKFMGWFPRVFGQLRQGDKGYRTKIVQVDPQMSVTGIKADEWVPNRPGTYGDLALGIAHLLLAENLYDQDLVNRFAGFEDWTDSDGSSQQGLKSLLSSPEYAPGAIAQRTGVDSQTLLRITHELADHQPAIAISDERCLWHADGLYQAQAVLLLNILLGSVGTKGGVLARAKLPIQSPSASQVSEGSDASGSQRPLPTITADELAEVLSQDGINPQTMLIFDVDPIYLCNDPERLQKLIGEVPLVVCVDSLPNDTSRFADMILPDHSALEKWQMATTPSGFAGMNLSISPPVLEPLYDTRDSCDLVIKILNEAADSSGKSRWENSEQVLKSIAKELYDSGMGLTFSESYDPSWIRLLAERGMRYPGYDSFDEFWPDLTDKGGWWQPDYENGLLQKRLSSSSNKPSLTQLAQFVSQEIAKWSSLHDSESNSGAAANSQERKPDQFWLNIFQVPSFGRDGQGAYSPMLLEMSSHFLKHEWASWIEINPETAAQLGLTERDWVWIISETTKLQAQVRLYAGAQPDVVSVPLGLGHENDSRYADGVGMNPLRLAVPPQVAHDGQIAWLDTKVKIVKVADGEKLNA